MMECPECKKTDTICVGKMNPIYIYTCQNCGEIFRVKVKNSKREVKL